MADFSVDGSKQVASWLEIQIGTVDLRRGSKGAERALAPPLSQILQNKVPKNDQIRAPCPLKIKFKKKNVFFFFSFYFFF